MANRLKLSSGNIRQPLPASYTPFIRLLHGINAENIHATQQKGDNIRGHFDAACISDSEQIRYMRFAQGHGQASRRLHYQYSLPTSLFQADVKLLLTTHCDRQARWHQAQ